MQESSFKTEQLLHSSIDFDGSFRETCGAEPILSFLQFRKILCKRYKVTGYVNDRVVRTSSADACPLLN